MDRAALAYIRRGELLPIHPVIDVRISASR